MFFKKIRQGQKNGVRNGTFVFVNRKPMSGGWGSWALKFQFHQMIVISLDDLASQRRIRIDSHFFLVQV